LRRGPAAGSIRQLGPRTRTIEIAYDRSKKSPRRSRNCV